MGGGGEEKKPLTSTNVGISPENILTFSFNSSETLVLLNLIELEPRVDLKNVCFLVKSL